VVKRAPQRGRDRSCTGANLNDPAVCIVSHHHAARVACQALRRSRGNARAAVEHGLTGRVGIREHLGVDVDHHLVALARIARIDPVVQRRLRDERQRAGLLLLHGRRLRRTVDDGRAWARTELHP
jgi:hypothetical protein